MTKYNYPITGTFIDEITYEHGKSNYNLVMDLYKNPSKVTPKIIQETRDVKLDIQLKHHGFLFMKVCIEKIKNYRKSTTLKIKLMTNGLDTFIGMAH